MSNIVSFSQDLYESISEFSQDSVILNNIIESLSKDAAEEAGLLDPKELPKSKDLKEDKSKDSKEDADFRVGSTSYACEQVDKNQLSRNTATYEYTMTTKTSDYQSSQSELEKALLQNIYGEVLTCLFVDKTEGDSLRKLRRRRELEDQTSSQQVSGIYEIDSFPADSKKGECGVNEETGETCHIMNGYMTFFTLSGADITEAQAKMANAIQNSMASGIFDQGAVDDSLVGVTYVDDGGVKFLGREDDDEEGEIEISKALATGDNDQSGGRIGNVFLILAFVILALLLLMIFICRRRRKNRDEYSQVDDKLESKRNLRAIEEEAATEYESSVYDESDNEPPQRQRQTRAMVYNKTSTKSIRSHDRSQRTAYDDFVTYESDDGVEAEPSKYSQAAGRTNNTNKKKINRTSSGSSGKSHRSRLTTTPRGVEVEQLEIELMLAKSNSGSDATPAASSNHLSSNDRSKIFRQAQAQAQANASEHGGNSSSYVQQRGLQKSNYNTYTSSQRSRGSQNSQESQTRFVNVRQQGSERDYRNQRKANYSESVIL